MATPNHPTRKTSAGFKKVRSVKSQPRFGTADRAIKSETGAGKILKFLSRGAPVHSSGLDKPFGPINWLRNKYSF